MGDVLRNSFRRKPPVSKPDDLAAQIQRERARCDCWTCSAAVREAIEGMTIDDLIAVAAERGVRLGLIGRPRG